MNQSFKTLFFLKKGKGYLKGAMPVYVRITIDGKRAECSIQRSCDPSKWNQKTGRATGSKAEAVQLNAYLDTVQGVIFNIQKDSTLRSEPVTSALVISRLLHKKEERKHSLIEVFTYHNEQFSKLVGQEYAEGTMKKFKTALFHLQSFIQWKFNRNDVSLAEVNYLFVTEYEFYLKSIQKLQHNSAMSNVKKLKKIVRQCIANEWMTHDPFKSYKITTKETYRNFLLKDELELLSVKKLFMPRLDQVRDIFLFSCYTGLSYADVVKLTVNDVAIGIDGKQWIFTSRIKTDTPSRIPILPVAKGIIEKYRGHPKVALSGKLLPNMSNEKLNCYLKEITTLCGFNKELTFHCARHTFATTVTLTNGVPIETVGKMLGHKNIRTTQIYAKILDSKVSEDMQNLKKRLSINHDATASKAV